MITAMIFNLKNYLDTAKKNSLVLYTIFKELYIYLILKEIFIVVIRNNYIINMLSLHETSKN